MNKRPRRSSEHGIASLASLIASGARVVFVTGAGLSVASGIAPFRGRDDAVWNSSLFDYGTRARFVKDPLGWYNEFWLKHRMHRVHEKKPNAGHQAISELLAAHPTVSLITQNVDGLHGYENVIQAHGRADVYKCFTQKCTYSFERAVEDVELAIDASEVMGAPPLCPSCNTPLCPNVLLFDEDYFSHKSYAFEDVQETLANADAVAFVGTSFAVRITDFAFQACEERLPAPGVAFNFNLVNNTPAAKTSKIVCQFVEGRAEETLVQLVQAVRRVCEEGDGGAEP